MRYIAHRGLFRGPDKQLENRPEQIMLALKNGYDAEIDLWVINSELYLGHDEPTYMINEDFINTPGFWIHAKNLAALRRLRGTGLNYFRSEEHTSELQSH